MKNLITLSMIALCFFTAPQTILGQCFSYMGHEVVSEAPLCGQIRINLGTNLPFNTGVFNITWESAGQSTTKKQYITSPYGETTIFSPYGFFSWQTNDSIRLHIAETSDELSNDCQEFETIIYLQDGINCPTPPEGFGVISITGEDEYIAEEISDTTTWFPAITSGRHYPPYPSADRLDSITVHIPSTLTFDEARIIMRIPNEVIPDLERFNVIGNLANNKLVFTSMPGNSIEFLKSGSEYTRQQNIEIQFTNVEGYGDVRLDETSLYFKDTLVDVEIIGSSQMRVIETSNECDNIQMDVADSNTETCNNPTNLNITISNIGNTNILGNFLFFEIATEEIPETETLEDRIGFNVFLNGVVAPDAFTDEGSYNSLSQKWDVILYFNQTIILQPNETIEVFIEIDPNFSGEIKLGSDQYGFCDQPGLTPMPGVDQSPVLFDSPTEINLYTLLEGAYNASTEEMTTILNTDRGLLPGQTPIGALATPTPAGQPYNSAPWNYAGTEGMGWTDADYSSNVVDWVLVSFRTDIQKNTEVAMSAGLLMKDGGITFPDACGLNTTHDSVYVVIEHRNHMGIMTPEAIPIVDGVLNYDFSTLNSYRNEASFGQKQMPDGKWVMFSGDTDQAADMPGYDINGSDKVPWVPVNGFFNMYHPADNNLNGDITGADKALWLSNNGTYSIVPK